jgi:hypothetical protein
MVPGANGCVHRFCGHVCFVARAPEYPPLLAQKIELELGQIIPDNNVICDSRIRALPTPV